MSLFIDPKVPKKGDLGNTKTDGPKQISPAKHWCFTLHKPTEEEISSIVLKFDEMCKKYIFAEEWGAEKKTYHLQGYVEFWEKLRPLSLNLKKTIHWEKKKYRATETDNVNYITKEKGRKWVKGIKIPKPVRTITLLRPWQKEIENICLSEPDDRKIYWYWENVGNIGKSAFTKYMAIKHGAVKLSNGKSGDIMNLVFNLDMEECRTVIFDLPRCTLNRINYAAIEDLKNGHIVNFKYETGSKVFEPPNVIIFANSPPEDLEMLSADRWEIKELKL